jgi:cobalt-zinc-cadmium efflux system membrane fusion protein
VRPDQDRLAKVVARIPGVVREVLVKQGALVKAGDPIAVLESRELAELKLAYLEAGQRWSTARQVAEREADLAARKISSQEAARRQQRAAAETGQSAVTALQKLKVLGLTEADLASARREQGQALGRLLIRAPLAGSITQVRVTVGAAVTAETEVAEIMDLAAVWGEVQVPARELGDLKVGQSVPVRSLALKQPTSAPVAYIAPVADATSRTVLVRLTLANPTGAWRPGTCFQAELRTRAELAAVTVPREALHDLDGRTAVFVRRGPTEYELRYVKVGASDDRVAAITEGLRAGEPVATTNSLTLKAEFLSRSE